MTPQQLIASIYFGDRAIIGYSVDSWRREVVLSFDLLSRIRSSSGTWDHYHDEDIESGELVFLGVSEFSVAPLGVIPDDLILDVRLSMKDEGFEFVLETSTTRDADILPATVALLARDFYIRDPRQKDVQIRK
ncbi:DUF6258 family protein [Pseudomarimonas arenosa]|uniref:Uncharacterized protein n=1 Tax=Pseudomarimonas arenosa TaxID=2774145 RepID=A0AAW3ZR74_9GAMM|nr:DUF6258 family protein [Pseudomarimonas arenosa]MBD8527974.1 hypothetical protein [Pseudomarimonas arenosa]